MDHGVEVQRERSARGMAQLAALGDRLAATLPGLVRIAEKPLRYGSKSLASTFGVLPVKVNVAAMSFGIVQRNTMVCMLARGGWIAKAERSDHQGHVSLEDLCLVVGALTQREKPLGEFQRLPQVGAHFVEHPPPAKHQEEKSIFLQ